MIFFIMKSSFFNLMLSCSTVNCCELAGNRFPVSNAFLFNLVLIVCAYFTVAGYKSSKKEGI